MAKPMVGVLSVALLLGLAFHLSLNDRSSLQANLNSPEQATESRGERAGNWEYWAAEEDDSESEPLPPSDEEGSPEQEEEDEPAGIAGL